MSNKTIDHHSKFTVLWLFVPNILTKVKFCSHIHVTHSAQNGKIIDQSQPFKHPLKLGFNLVDIFLSKKKLS
jgi:hypothetical protein